MRFFVFENDKLNVNVPEILLIKEFADLWEPNRNITSSDKKGEKRTRAYRELAYIWLALDWQSMYSGYNEQDRHQEALKDANLSEKEFNDPLFRAACRKYKNLQDENIAVKMLMSARNVALRFIDHYDNLDISERDPLTGKYLLKDTDVMKGISSLGPMIDSLKELEWRVKQEKEEEGSLRGGEEDGFQPEDL